jgi:hypothetical protein
MVGKKHGHHSKKLGGRHSDISLLKNPHEWKGATDALNDASFYAAKKGQELNRDGATEIVEAPQTLDRALAGLASGMANGGHRPKGPKITP